MVRDASRSGRCCRQGCLHTVHVDWCDVRVGVTTPSSAYAIQQHWKRRGKKGRDRGVKGHWDRWPNQLQAKKKVASGGTKAIGGQLHMVLCLCRD